MNTQSDAMSRSMDSARVLPAAAIQPFLWSLRRELWENRSIYIAPLAVAAVALFGFLTSIFSGRFTLRTAHQGLSMTMPYDFAAGVIMLTAMAVGVFYSAEALYAERRDRSILFWKSLPVSDLTAVFSKAVIPIFVIQFIGFAVTVVLQFLMLALGSVALLAKGQSPATLWSGVAFFQMALMLLYHLFTVHMLWHAPFYAWLLMVSAWAKRTPFLWAVLPPLAVGVLEKLIFNTSYFGHLIMHRLMGGAESMTMGQGMPIHSETILTFGRFLTSPGLWMGLAVSAGFLVIAARVRRYRGPV